MGKKQETIKNCPTELLGVQKQNDRNWKPKFKRRLDTAEEKLVNWKSDLKKLSKCIYKMRDCKFGQWNKKSNIHVIRIL